MQILVEPSQANLLPQALSLSVSRVGFRYIVLGRQRFANSGAHRGLQLLLVLLLLFSRMIISVFVKVTDPFFVFVAAVQPENQQVIRTDTNRDRAPDHDDHQHRK